MTLILFHDRGCPFTHRVLALADHLGLELDYRQSLVGDVPPGLDQYSANGSIPLLVDDGLIIIESRVMLEHLAERHHWEDAYPADLPSRTRHRHAMAVTDEHLAPALMNGAPPRRLADILDTLEGVIGGAPRPCLLTFHVAPIWLRFRLWRPSGEIVRAIGDRPSLCRWLDDAVALDAIANTSPDPETHAIDMARAREAGLMPG